MLFYFLVYVSTRTVQWQEERQQPLVEVISKWKSYRSTPSLLLQPRGSRWNREPEIFKGKLQQNGIEQRGVAAWYNTASCCYYWNSCLFVICAATKWLWKVGRVHHFATTDTLTLQGSSERGNAQVKVFLGRKWEQYWIYERIKRKLFSTGFYISEQRVDKWIVINQWPIDRWKTNGHAIRRVRNKSLVV